MITNFHCSVHPREVTTAAVTTETGETVGMCLMCYAAWCKAKRRANNHGTANDLDAALLRIKLTREASDLACPQCGMDAGRHKFSCTAGERT